MELEIVIYLNHIKSSAIDSISLGISWIPFIMILYSTLALTPLFFDKTNGKAIFISLIIAIALHFLISEGLFKHYLLNCIPFRERPYIAHPDIINPIGKQLSDSSFPSNHMSSSLSILTVLIFHYRKFWPLALFFVLLLAFSRMHNGMHYPSDVLIGSFLGVIYAAISIWVVKKIFKKNQNLV